MRGLKWLLKLCNIELDLLVDCAESLPEKQYQDVLDHVFNKMTEQPKFRPVYVFQSG